MVTHYQQIYFYFLFVYFKKRGGPPKHTHKQVKGGGSTPKTPPLRTHLVRIISMNRSYSIYGKWVSKSIPLKSPYITSLTAKVCMLTICYITQALSYIPGEGFT